MREMGRGKGGCVYIRGKTLRAAARMEGITSSSEREVVDEHPPSKHHISHPFPVDLLGNPCAT